MVFFQKILNMSEPVFYVRGFSSGNTLQRFVNLNKITSNQIVEINYHHNFFIHFYYGGELRYDTYDYLSNQRKEQVKPVLELYESEHRPNVDVLSKYLIYPVEMEKEPNLIRRLVEHLKKINTGNGFNIG